MENRIITISREYGSGGREIGRMVAEKLGIKCYDSDLIQRTVDKSGFNADFVKEGGEDATGGWFSMFLADRTRGKTNQDKLWESQSQVISELADKESCVIVGRCADYILRARADCLTVFIHADPDKRAERAVQEYGDREESVQKRLKEKDKRRAAVNGAKQERIITSALTAASWELKSALESSRSCTEYRTNCKSLPV